MDKFSNLSNELEYNRLYNYLTSVARKACDKRFKYTSSLDEISHRRHLYEQGIVISYGDILEKFGKDCSNLSHQYQLYPILDEINKNNKPILLSALVVNKKEYLPSEPFFKKWDVESWESELKKIWHYYCQENNSIDFTDEKNHNHRKGQITTNNMEIKKYLMEIAKKKQTMTYMEFRDVLGLKYTIQVFNLLKQISNDCIKNGEPILSALIVNEDGIPGSGYFESYGTITKSEAKEIHQCELAKVFNWNW